MVMKCPDMADPVDVVVVKASVPEVLFDKCG
jgi:hypothetical protein